MKFLPSWSQHSRSQPPCLDRAEWLGLGGMALPPSWSQATATTPAHNTFLQPLTSPPSNQERGEERRDRGLVVVYFMLSAGVLHWSNCRHEIPCRKQLLLINMFFSTCLDLNSFQIILSYQLLCTFSTKVPFNKKPPRWFTDAQQGTNGNLMFLSMLRRVRSPPHLSPSPRVIGCIS